MRDYCIAVVVVAAFPEIPYGVFFVIGSEFRGFHVRFRDVARGGIRIVKSTNLQVSGNQLSEGIRDSGDPRGRAYGFTSVWLCVVSCRGTCSRW